MSVPKDRARAVGRFWLVALGALLVTGCHAASSSPHDAGRGGGGSGAGDGGPSGSWIVRGAHGTQGSGVEFAVDGKRVAGLDEVPAASPVVDLSGYFVVPAFIDSHVHLSYYAVADGLPAGGVVGAADFAAPLESLLVELPIVVARSGPMITPIGGYPTQSWGAGGFGLEVGSVAEATAAVDRVLESGASFIKTPLVGDLGVDDATLLAIVERAHASGARVAVHALGAVDAARAIASDVDILGHTPTEALTGELVQAFGRRTVVGTLSAFGAGSAAVENLRAFRAAGALVLYGTDLGNTRQVGIQGAELAAMTQAGFSGSDIVRSATSDAATFWGFTELGSLEPGKRASFLVLDEDPNANPQTLAAPRAVVFDGRVVTGTLP